MHHLRSFFLPARREPVAKAPRFYLPELDVVRFGAFLTVFLHHLVHRQPYAHTAPVMAIINALSFGLPLFFALSGYLITTLLLKEIDRTGTVSLRKFYERRMLRIWPLYMLALGAGIVLAMHRSVLPVQWPWFAAALVMGANLLPIPATVVGHLWSISIEEQFYLVWPAIMKAINTVGRRGLLLSAIAIIVLANVTLVHLDQVHAALDTRVWFNSFVQFEMIAAGILLGLAGTRAAPPAWCRAIELATVPLLWFVASYVCRIKSLVPPTPRPLALCAGYALVAISCVLVIHGVRGWSAWPRWMTYLGKISYGLYVFHFPMIHLFTKLTVVPRGVCALTSTVALAMLSYRFLETPFLRLKQRLQVIDTRPMDSSSHVPQRA